MTYFGKLRGVGGRAIVAEIYILHFAFFLVKQYTFCIFDCRSLDLLSVCLVSRQTNAKEGGRELEKVPQGNILNKFNFFIHIFKGYFSTFSTFHVQEVKITGGRLFVT